MSWYRAVGRNGTSHEGLRKVVWVSPWVLSIDAAKAHAVDRLGSYDEVLVQEQVNGVPMDRYDIMLARPRSTRY